MSILGHESVGGCAESKLVRPSAEKCLIATDVDKTLVEQGHSREREIFLGGVAPQLIEAAEHGAQLALLTGNSMSELCTRILPWIVRQLCTTDRLHLLARFHCFCNSGGVYFHFPEDKGVLAKLLADPHARQHEKTALLRLLHGDAVNPQSIDPEYLERCTIVDHDAEMIREILALASNEYLTLLDGRAVDFSAEYDLTVARDGEQWRMPSVELRRVTYGAPHATNQATAQITLKPVLSFRYARFPEKAFGNDPRSQVITFIQSQLDARGLGHFVARAGGRGSIDITLAKLDKAYALNFLLDRLNLQGNPRWGQHTGSNAVYFGDEVIVGGGNDYPVTRIPGLLVFAVNPDRELIPFISNVLAASPILEGPTATKDILIQFNRCATRLEFLHNDSTVGHVETALDVFKREFFLSRIRAKINATSLEHKCTDLQTLHTFVTLMCREDPASQAWLSILVNQLDAIMIHLASMGRPSQPAIGTSHPDSGVRSNPFSR